MRLKNNEKKEKKEQRRGKKEEGVISKEWKRKTKGTYIVHPASNFSPMILLVLSFLFLLSSICDNSCAVRGGGSRSSSSSIKSSFSLSGTFGCDVGVAEVEGVDGVAGVVGLLVVGGVTMM